MKHYLNLNSIAGSIVAAILALALLIPGLLWLLNQVFSSVIFARMGRISLAVGLALIGLFALLVVLEQAQDAWIGARHRRSLGRRLPLPGPLAECPFCGSRQVRPFDRACPACGQDAG